MMPLFGWVGWLVGWLVDARSKVGIPAYASSKGAVASLTRQMAMDYSSNGIRTVCVSPGTIRTPLVESLVQQVRTWALHRAWACTYELVGWVDDHNDKQPVGR